MFKDFHRRLQRDLKKIVDARVLASDARLGGEIKVWIFLPSLILYFKLANALLFLFQLIYIIYLFMKDLMEIFTVRHNQWK